MSVPKFEDPPVDYVPSLAEHLAENSIAFANSVLRLVAADLAVNQVSNPSAGSALRSAVACVANVAAGPDLFAAPASDAASDAASDWAGRSV